MADGPSDYMTEGRATTAYDLERYERRHHVIELRREGYTYAQIQERLENLDPPIKTTLANIAKIIQRHLRALSEADADTVDDLRTLENERLDALWQAYYESATGKDGRPPNMKAASFLLNLSARRAKMNGLDAAQKVEHHGQIQHLHELGVDPDELADAEAAFKETYSKPGIEPPAIVVEGSAQEIPEKV